MTPASWTGPLPEDLDTEGTLLCPPLPPERWPYGPPEHHESCCLLRDGGSYCDCKASDASDSHFGSGA